VQGATDITKLKFEYNGETLIPISTWLTDLNYVYIKFQRPDNTTLNLAVDQIVKYIVND